MGNLIKLGVGYALEFEKERESGLELGQGTSGKLNNWSTTP